MMKMAGDLCSRSQTERLIWDQAQGIRRHSAQHQCHSRLGWSNSSWCSTVVQQELFITHSLFRTGTQPASQGGSYNWAWGQTTWSSIAGVGLACSNLRSSRGRPRLLTQSSRCRSERLVQAVLLSLLAKSWDFPRCWEFEKGVRPFPPPFCWGSAGIFDASSKRFQHCWNCWACPARGSGTRSGVARNSAHLQGGGGRVLSDLRLSVGP